MRRGHAGSAGEGGLHTAMAFTWGEQKHGVPRVTQGGGGTLGSLFKKPTSSATSSRMSPAESMAASGGRPNCSASATGEEVTCQFYGRTVSWFLCNGPLPSSASARFLRFSFSRLGFASSGPLFRTLLGPQTTHSFEPKQRFETHFAVIEPTVSEKCQSASVQLPIFRTMKIGKLSMKMRCQQRLF